ncbi:Homeodomain-like protein [Cynara cardunculus var. scolymus]|uniref:Homeodomain-like protein n=1 Tax=Cynara cardunculus var. scolymus TaxID=59895 RepID=A0A103LXU6_CYNCS|nr:Homeodomain-like protein [Cynara cardunculus var. scolymus]
MEKQMLFDLQEKYGNKWAKIATYLPGRSVVHVKNIWYNHQEEEEEEEEEEDDDDDFKVGCIICYEQTRPKESRCFFVVVDDDHCVKVDETLHRIVNEQSYTNYEDSGVQVCCWCTLLIMEKGRIFLAMLTQLLQTPLV